MKNPKIIREGDRVRIVVPKVVVRVGYPKAVKDYLDEAEKAYGAQLLKDMSDWCAKKVLQQIAYGLAKADGFGGRERSLHFKEQPNLLGQEFTVSGVRMVQTGTYYPPSGGYNAYQGDYDYEPGGLADMKARRLVSGFGWVQFTSDRLEIPVEHLEKVS
jgi:hypothetical protein